MKKRETKKINNVNFEVNEVDYYEYTPAIDYCSIYDAYNSPSSTKVSIWNSWRDWFLTNNGYCSVRSRNSRKFTIHGIVEDKETHKSYYCYITASHNKAYLIREV